MRIVERKLGVSLTQKPSARRTNDSIRCMTDEEVMGPYSCVSKKDAKPLNGFMKSGLSEDMAFFVPISNR